MTIRSLIQDSSSTHPHLTAVLCNLLWLVPPAVYIASDLFYFSNQSMTGYVEHTHCGLVFPIAQVLTAILALYSTANLVQVVWPSRDWWRLLLALFPAIVAVGILAFAIVSHIMP